MPSLTILPILSITLLILISSPFSLAQQSSVLTQLCVSTVAHADRSIIACAMRLQCISSGSTDPQCLESALVATLCRYDAEMEAVKALGVCSSNICFGASTLVPTLAPTTAFSPTTTASSTSLPTSSSVPSSSSAASCPAAIPSLFSSQTAYTQITSMCRIMRMSDCDKCTFSATFTATSVPNCDLLSVYGGLCLIMPSMSSCSLQKSACEDPIVSTHPCSLSPIGSTPDAGDQILLAPIMHYVLFESFVPRNLAQYTGACIMTALLAIAMMCVENVRKRMEMGYRERCKLASQKTATKADGELNDAVVVVDDSASSSSATTSACCNNTTTSTATKPTPTSAIATPSSPPSTSRLAAHTSAWFSPYRFDSDAELHYVLRALLRTVEVMLAYLLMLVVMQFNVGLIVAALVGVDVRGKAGGEGDCCM
ncbi:Ctr copper transporter family-domain-containing protein [Chytridium lagenaria]|nr:Ctr copper transporter family-domain-containing protein [Chytridium lagenaria]